MTSTMSMERLNSTRTARPRHILMCEPKYFDVRYSINPWMDPRQPTSTQTGLNEWKNLHDLFVDLGHRVDLVPARPGLLDMVFAANGATVIDGKVLVARFRHAQRQGESAAFVEWFRQQGWDEVRMAGHDNEGEGDILFTGNEILAGQGFRTAASAHGEVRRFFDREVVSLTLVDPRFYHLDTALAVIDTGEVMYYPDAFDGPSREVLAERFPDSILATERDATMFGLNAFSDGKHVVLPEAATGLAGQLAERGFEPIGVALGELLKAGGSVKCCTLELRRHGHHRLA